MDNGTKQLLTEFMFSLKVLHLFDESKQMKNLGVSEPIGSSVPKFSVNDNLHGIVEKAATAFSLPCSAQGSPVPTFR